MLHRLVKKAGQALFKDILLFGEDEDKQASILAILQDNLRDNPAEDDINQFFIKDLRNIQPVDGILQLRNRIQSNEVQRVEFINKNITKTNGGKVV